MVEQAKEDSQKWIFALWLEGEETESSESLAARRTGVPSNLGPQRWSLFFDEKGFDRKNEVF